MSQLKKTASPNTPLTAYFWSEEGLRSRSVSSLLLHSTLDIPRPPVRVTADWDREVTSLGLEIGDIESLPLARTIVRWPDYQACALAVSAWMQTLNLPALLEESNDLSLMACRGTPYHHDGAQYGNAAFCNLFLSEDRGMDLHFSSLDQRIPLTCGTVVIFDTAQPHAVIPRGCNGFNCADFASPQDCTQLFLTWELPIENVGLQEALQIGLDTDVVGAEQVGEQKICANDVALRVCSASGRWWPAE